MTAGIQTLPEPTAIGERRLHRRDDPAGAQLARAFADTLAPVLDAAAIARSLAQVLTSLAQEERRQGQARVLHIAAAQVERLQPLLAAAAADREDAARYRRLRLQPGVAGDRHTVALDAFLDAQRSADPARDPVG